MTKPELRYFLPRHETSKFLYDLKAKNLRYNVNLMNKNPSETKHFGSFICDLMKMKRKLPKHQNK